MNQSEITYLPIDQIQAYTDNAKYSDSNIEAICRYIESSDVVLPIILDNNRAILKGHGLYLATKKLGLTVAPVIILNTPN